MLPHPFKFRHRKKLLDALTCLYENRLNELLHLETSSEFKAKLAKQSPEHQKIVWQFVLTDSDYKQLVSAAHQKVLLSREKIDQARSNSDLQNAYWQLIALNASIDLLNYNYDRYAAGPGMMQCGPDKEELAKRKCHTVRRFNSSIGIGIHIRTESHRAYQEALWSIRLSLLNEGLFAPKKRTLRS